MLGLVACLNFNGEKIAAQDAVDIMDNCEVIRRMPVSSFTGEYDYGNGSALADILYDKGLKFKYPKGSTPSSRRAIVVRTCAEFARDFKADSKWDNLDKWPY
ncbi:MULTISPECIES: hypothetical protein [Aeromonas]|uniref:hypothetical protein n=1 Tax=Aeromonas TaxID=642 RepID=UPI000FE2EB67|nr:hypothetical protein [Aeromonas caviae]